MAQIALPSWPGVLASILTATLLLSGCSSEHENNASTEQFNAFIDGAANNDAIHPEVRAFLIEKRDGGPLGFEEYREAVETYYGGCLEDSGFEYKIREFRNEGLPSVTVIAGPAASSELSPDQQSELYSICRDSTGFPLDAAYYLHPASSEIRSEYFEKFRESIVECISDHGLTVDPQAVPEEIRSAANSLLIEGQGDCLEETGYLTPYVPGPEDWE